MYCVLYPRYTVGALDLHNHSVAMALAAVRTVLNSMDFSKPDIKPDSKTSLPAPVANSAGTAVTTAAAADNSSSTSASSSDRGSDSSSSVHNSSRNGSASQFDELDDIDSSDSTDSRSSASASKRSSAASSKQQPQWPLHVHSCLQDLNIITGFAKNRDGVVPQVQPAVLHMLNTLGLDGQQHPINQGLLIVSSKSLLKYTKARLAAEAAAAGASSSSDRHSDRQSGRNSSRSHRDSKTPVRGRRQ
jgi:hypothetical protein